VHIFFAPPMDACAPKMVSALRAGPNERSSLTIRPETAPPTRTPRRAARAYIRPGPLRQDRLSVAQRRAARVWPSFRGARSGPASGSARCGSRRFRIGETPAAAFGPLTVERGQQTRRRLSPVERGRSPMRARRGPPDGRAGPGDEGLVGRGRLQRVGQGPRSAGSESSGSPAGRRARPGRVRRCVRCDQADGLGKPGTPEQWRGERQRRVNPADALPVARSIASRRSSAASRRARPPSAAPAPDGGRVDQDGELDGRVSLHPVTRTAPRAASRRNRKRAAVSGRQNQRGQGIRRRPCPHSENRPDDG